MMSDRSLLGILALQGDFARHARQVELGGAEARLVRLPDDLHGLDGICLPGGESTTMSLLLDRFALREPLAEFVASKPVLATCAGLILLATTIDDNQAGVKPFGVLDVSVQRNGWGRQVHSFDTEIHPLHGQNGLPPVRGSFIRAPRITRVGQRVDVLAVYQGEPVLIRQGAVLATTFHTELTDDTQLIDYFLRHFLPDRE